MHSLMGIRLLLENIFFFLNLFHYKFSIHTSLKDSLDTVDKRTGLCSQQ